MPASSRRRPFVGRRRGRVKRGLASRRAAAPGNLANLEATIRARTARVLGGLPRGETFDWVDRVCIELTTMMLATLFDFPFEDRRLLPYWSDVATAGIKGGGPIDGEEKREAELARCLDDFIRLWEERAKAPPRPDLLSVLAHGEATRNMPPREFLGNLTLLIVGKTIRKGDKVVMRYIPGDRDEEAIENPDAFIIDRVRPRQHLSFGFGIHRCVGNRLAELHLRILWEEILKRFERIEPMGEPGRIYSAFVHGITSLPVRIPA